MTGWAPVLAVMLPLTVAYAGALIWIWDSWFLPESYWSHGPLMPLLAAGLLWSGRARWAAQPARPAARAWLVLGPGLMLHLAGAALTIDSLSAASLAITLPAAVWLAWGGPRLRAVAPIVGLVLFTVPMPMFVAGAVAFEMKEIATDAGIGLAQFLGSEATRQGPAITLPGQATQLVVAEACSGLRSLVSLVTLGYCIAFFMGEQRGPRRWVLLLLAGPVAVLSNIVRIGVICLLAGWFDVEFASGTGHDLVSAGAWVLDLGILLGLDWALTRAQGAPGAGGAE